MTPIPLETPLDPVEARVLGVLIEKELTTPDQYPLSVNALVAGANQKSNRHPVMDLADAEVAAALERLRRRFLAGASYGTGQRVERYHQTAGPLLDAERPALAVHAELLLRGPQTQGELRSRAGRMHPFASLEELGRVLQALEAKGQVVHVPPPPGARAAAWASTLVPTDALATAPSRGEGVSPPARRTPEAAHAPALEGRVAALESEVARLGGLLDELLTELGRPPRVS